MVTVQIKNTNAKNINFLLVPSHINANLANFRVFLKLLGGFVALDKVDVSHKTSA